jgi:DNA (cytosine-5)-methyltransferase 1
MMKKIPSSPRSGGCACYTVLDLFSGIGGFSLGLTRAGFRTTAFCEIEEYPRSILHKHWPDVPIFNDVKELHASDLPEPVDVICGGYPCQPFSVAGQRKGKDDDRLLWPEIVRLIRELDATTGKPTWCIFENVAGHVSMGLDQVLSDLEGEGYAAWPFIIPACALNAPHRRDRVWIVAHDESRLDGGHNPGAVQRQEPKPGKGAGSNDVPDTQKHPAGGVFKPWFSANPASGSDLRGQAGEWITLPGVRARNDGLPNRVARLKALGNAVVPQIVEAIGQVILAV